MKRSVLNIILILLCTGSYAQQRNDSITQYYKYLNRALIAYYVDSSVDDAIRNFEQAESIYSNRSNYTLLLAELHGRKGHVREAIDYLDNAVLSGYNKRSIDWDQKDFSALQHDPVFEMLKANADSMSLNCQVQWNAELIKLVVFAVGKEQTARMLDYKKYGLSKDIFQKMYQDMDSQNYATLKQYFEENHPVALQQGLGISQSFFFVLLDHWIAGDLDSLNGNFFQRYIANETVHGRFFDNWFMPSILDYKMLGNAVQTYGTRYSYVKTADGKRTYLKIADTRSVDSLRASVNLPPLIVDAIRGNVQLPEGYHFDRDVYFKR